MADSDEMTWGQWMQEHGVKVISDPRMPPGSFIIGSAAGVRSWSARPFHDDDTLPVHTDESVTLTLERPEPERPRRWWRP